MEVDSNVSAPTKFVQGGNERYAYRRFGSGPGSPLLFLQHFMGTLDNWDYAVTDPLALGREVILFDSAGVGRSSGEVPQTIAGMAHHQRSAEAFLGELNPRQGMPVSETEARGRFPHRAIRPDALEETHDAWREHLARAALHDEDGTGTQPVSPRDRSAARHRAHAPLSLGGSVRSSR